MRQLSYIIGRLIQIIPVVLMVTVIIFLMIHLIPGDPVLHMLGDKATEEQIARMRHELGLDRPLLDQYFLFLSRIFTFNLGNSFIFKIPISRLLANRIPVTVLLTVMSTFFGILVSFPMGYLAAVRKDEAFDQGIRVWTLTALTMPSFWVGMLLLLLFALKLRWFPVGGWGDTWPEHIHGLILPAITQSLAMAALWTRNLRNNVVDVLRQDYVAFAKSKGLPERIVMGRHVLRNALISTVTLIAMSFTRRLGGTVIIETVFALPGVGQLMVSSIFARDYPVIQAITFAFALLVMVMNLVTDISYSFLDPRVKLD